MGITLIVLPVLLGQTALGAAFRPLSTTGWLLLLAGGVMVVLSPPKASAERTDADVQTTRSVGEVHRPTGPPARVTQIEPVNVPPRAPSSRTLGEAGKGNEPRQRPTALGADLFAAIAWRRFEAVVETLFGHAGFDERAVARPDADEGVDVWLYARSEPDGAPVSVVPCKH